MFILYVYHHKSLLIRSDYWIQAIHKDRIFWKNLLKNKEIVFQNGVKNIQAAAYNGARTVLNFLSECQCNVNGTLNGTTICNKTTGDCGSCKIGFFGEKCENGKLSFSSQKLVFFFQNCSDLLWQKSCSSDKEKKMKFKAEGQELAKCLKSLDHFFVTEGQNNFWKQIFLNLFLEVSLTHQNNYDSTWNRPDLKSYMKT